jgi:hypothetical protein
MPEARSGPQTGPRPPGIVREEVRWSWPVCEWSRMSATEWCTGWSPYPLPITSRILRTGLAATVIRAMRASPLLERVGDMTTLTNQIPISSAFP